MINNINILRFLTFVRNDIFTYYDTVSRQQGTAWMIAFLADRMVINVKTPNII
jgi:hypothetical protein